MYGVETDSHGGCSIAALVINCNLEDRVEKLEKATENFGIHVIYMNILNNPNEMTDLQWQQVLSTVFSPLAVPGGNDMGWS